MSDAGARHDPLAGLTSRPWEELPATLADLLDPDLDALAEELIAAIRERVPAYRRSLEGEFGAGLRTGVVEALSRFLDLIRNGGELPERAKRIYVEFGRWEAGEGRRLESLLAAYRLGARISWRRMVEATRDAELGEATIGRLAESIFAHIDELSSLSAAGFAAELAERAGERDRLRRRLLRMLVDERGAEEAVVREAADAAAWGLPAQLAALVYEASAPDRVAAHLPPGSLAATDGETAIALIPDPGAPGRREEIERALRGRAAALGTTVPWQDAARSATRARALHRLRADGTLRELGLVAADDHLATLITRSDQELLDELAARVLAPLDSLAEGPRARLEETLLAWLENRRVTKHTAKALHVHGQTVRYRVAQLRDLFGDALEDPDACFELHLALRGRRAVQL